jgi:thiol-disulfide isomerase/thioredoxin
VDTNGDGDLTNDPPVKGWEEGHEEKKGEVHRWYKGYGQVDIGSVGRPCVATLGLLTSKGEKGDELVYWRDYMRRGRVDIGGSVYRVWLDDWLATGDFTGETPPQDTLREVPRIGFLVDRNGNGTTDGASEGFEVGKPFNIGGVTYEIRDMTPSGDFFRIVKSSRHVEELPLAADIAVGKVAPAFVGPGLDGRAVHVPGDFMGKVVLLEFWATWCGPCIRLVPQLRDVYAKYHGKGLEIVAVSEDDAEDRQKVIDMVKQERMNWVQIYDGKADYTVAAVRYGAGALPWAALLDGDTGVVLATEFHKEGLDAVIEREMRKKGLLGE